MKKYTLFRRLAIILIPLLMFFTAILIFSISVSATTPTWPDETDWIFIGYDKGEDGTADDFRDINATYYYFDVDYLYLRMKCLADAELNNGTKDGRFKWFFDLDGDAYIKGGEAYLTEYMLFVEDTNNPEDGQGELYFLWDTNNDGYYNEWEGGVYYTEEVTNISISNYSISGIYVDFWINLDNLSNPTLLYLLWSTDQENPNLDQSPNTDRPDNATFINLQINNCPVANDDSYSTPEDTSLNIGAPGILSNDVDPESDTLTAVLDTDVSHGTLILYSDGSFDYTPDAEWCGTDTFTYHANDGTCDSNIATVTITVTCVNDCPVANDDSYSTPEDTSLNIGAPGILSNDVDPESDTLTAVLDTDVSHGTLILYSDGSFDYTPDAEWCGTDTFTYHANDGTCDSNIATVTITVTCVNDCPVANDDSYSTPEDTSLNIGAPGILSNDVDPESDTLTAVLDTDVSHGTLILYSDGSFDYTPDAEWCGTDTFTYHANDGTCDSNIATVTITVTCVNDCPVANDDSYSTPEDTSLNIGAPGILSNDVDPESDTLTAVLDTDVSHGTLILYSDGSFDYTPDAEWCGTDTFTYHANDGTCDSNIATVTITVTCVNDCPVANDDSYSTPEDTSLNIGAPGILSNDVDPESDTLTAVLDTDVSHGTLILYSDGSFDYTPDAEWCGTDTFTYHANDGTCDSNIATVTITVTCVNDCPVANDDSYSTPEDTSLNIGAPGILSNDVDPESDTLTAVLDTDVSHGTLILYSDGSFDYTPDAEWCGTDTFTYHANDGTCDSNIATVTITVTCVNDCPVANDDSYSTPEDTSLNIGAPGILSNDVDPESDTLTAVLDTDVSHGTLILYSDGSFDYTPDAEWCGTDTFTYHANDGTCDSNIATVTITVTCVNDCPVANDDSYSTPEDTSLNIGAPGILSNDVDPESDTLTAVLDTDVSHGTLILYSDGSFDYTPDAEWCGTDTFTYHANDGTCDSNIATVTITVTCVNDCPVANDDSYSTPEDTSLNIGAPGILSNDVDPESDTLTAVLDTDVSHGTLILYSDGSFDYTPDAEWCGTDTFTYHANDGTCDSNIATVTITVTCVNDCPVANDDSYSTPEDTSLNIGAPGILSNDVDPESDTLTAVLDTDVSHGTLILYSDGSFDYTPDAEWCGTDTFTYHANDGTCDSNIATVTITVTCVNDCPVANDDSYSTPEDTSLNIGAPGILSNDVDPESDTLTAVLDTDVSHGTLILYSDGSFDYTPDAEWCGTDTFTYHANDGTCDSNIATVTITVTCVNDCPVANDDSYSTPEDTSLNIGAPGILSNDVDPESDTLTAVLDTDVSHGTLILYSDGSFDYTPDAEWCGTDTFTYHANDGTCDSNIATVTITVTCVNDCPVANDDSYSTPEDTSLNIGAPGILSNDVDPESDTLTAVLDTDVSHGTLILYSDGSFDYTPDAEWCGTDTFTYHANDGTCDSNIATVTITVTCVNDCPVANDDSYSTPEDTSLNIGAPGILSNDVDPESDTLTAVLDTDVSHGTLILYSDGSFDYTPDAEWCGTDTFTYHANDGTCDSNIATVTITVTCVNDCPVANDDYYITVMDVPLIVSAPGVLINDTDPDGDILIAIKLTNPTNGFLTAFNSDGSFEYISDSGFIGDDSFIYQIDDGNCTDTATVYITVKPPTCVPEVWIDDDYGYSTPGWGIDHFVSIQNALDHLEPYGIAHVNDGVYYENILIDDVPWCDNTGITIVGEYGCFPIDDAAVIQGDTVISVDDVTIKYLEFAPTSDGAITVEDGVSSITLRCNKFRRDCVADAVGVKNLGSSQVNAELNWWGAPDGPSGGKMDDGDIADGNGVEVIGNVDVEPWIGIHAEIAEPTGTIEVEVGTSVRFDAEGSWAYTYGECCQEAEELPLQYLWDFDDGMQSANKQANHVFDTAGTYHVSLMVDSSGIPGLYSNFMYDWDYVTVHVTTPGTPLTASADGENLGGYETIVGEPVQLYGDAYSGNGEYQFTWNFGDNKGTSNEQNPTHVYDAADAYTVTLTVTSGGETATDTAEVVVNDIDELLVDISDGNSIAGVETMFAASVTGGTSPYTYEWIFGDGATSSEARPSHTYATVGEYTVTVTVTDSNDNSKSDSATVTVEEGSSVEPVEIKEVSGGFGVKAVIDSGDSDVDWTITVDGTVFIGGEAEGSIGANVEETVKLPFTLGFGKVDITITANEIQETYSAFALGPFFLNIQEA